MYIESAYNSYDNEEFQLNNTATYRPGRQEGFVNSCGLYRFISRDNFETYRPRGLHDCQLLYLSRGAATYYIRGKEHLVKEGSVIIYYPMEPQRYIYRLRFKPEVYWIHFEYKPMKPLMETLGLDGLHLFEIGIHYECTDFMRQIIHELQLKNPYYPQLCNSMLEALLTQIARKKAAHTGDDKKTANVSMETAIQYFHHKYNEPITISDFCREYHMNDQSFRKSFKEYTGLSPKKFLMDVRMKKAMEFMQDSHLTFMEIASMVGYSDSLYFSRCFHRYTGKSPRDYRKQILHI